MIEIRVDPHSSIHPSQQLIDAVLDVIASGTLGASDRLPSIRRLSELALVNPNTVAKAYRSLDHLGVVEGRNGSGVFVTTDGPSIAQRLRLDSTLNEYRRATGEALRVGHSSVRLGQLLNDLDPNQPKPVVPTLRKKR